MNDHFKALITASGLSQSKVADHLAKVAGQFCTERQIRGLIAEPGLKNSRACPQWVIDAMSVFEPVAAAA